jgi:phospholipase/lecithinase/hemolysin
VGRSSKRLKQFVFTVNSLLEVEILPYAWSRGTKIDLVDINLIFTQLVLDPAKFGFTNSTGAA